MGKVRIIKLGGSLLSKKDKLFDFKYLGDLRDVIEERFKEKEKFGIVSGGGYTMRAYRDIALNDGNINEKKQLHWIGTTVNVLHAEIIRAFLNDIAFDRPMMYEQFSDPDVKHKFSEDKPILVGGGSRPGLSSDSVSMLMAEKLGSKEIISLKGIDYLYSADPKKDKMAEIVKRATWDEYLDIIGGEREHLPGGNYAIDPVAAHWGREKGFRFVLLNGGNFDNLRAYLNGSKDFKGSVIEG